MKKAAFLFASLSLLTVACGGTVYPGEPGTPVAHPPPIEHPSMSPEADPAIGMGLIGTPPVWFGPTDRTHQIATLDVNHPYSTTLLGENLIFCLEVAQSGALGSMSRYRVYDLDNIQNPDHMIGEAPAGPGCLAAPTTMSGLDTNGDKFFDPLKIPAGKRGRFGIYLQLGTDAPLVSQELTLSIKGIFAHDGAEVRGASTPTKVTLFQK